MSRSAARSASGVADEIAHRDPRMGRAEVGDQDDAGVAVEGEHGGRAAAGRGAAAGLVDEALAEQRVDALGDRRAGEPGHPREVGPRDRDFLADQLQERACAGRATTGPAESSSPSLKSKARSGRSSRIFCLTVGLSLFRFAR